MIATSNETTPPLASALVRAGGSGSGRRVTLPNGPASGSVTPFMDRRMFLGTMTGSLLAAPLAAEAQQPGKAYRIGVIVTSAPNETEHVIKALSEGLRELGYVDGQNIVMERRYAEGRQERLPALAEELVRLNVDVIVTGSNPVVAAVKQTTTKIPIVMAVSRDPVGAGFVASLARPGGNITGLSNDPGPRSTPRISRS